MIKRKPLGSLVSIGCTVDTGTDSGATALFAQAGNGTALVCLGAKDSPPARELCVATASPDACGVMITTTALSLVKYFFATRFTSATVTFLIASISSSIEFRSSTASACDHSAASPEIELRQTSPSATSRRFVASPKSSLKP